MASTKQPSEIRFARELGQSANGIGERDKLYAG